MSAPRPQDQPSGSTLDPPRRATPDGVAPSYQAGDIIAQKYRLTRMLGEGGMGAVWLARNLKLDVDVAIKLIRHELGTAEASHRLLQEARAAARIGHRSIVRIFDFGETELDDPFIVMEVLTGESLRDVLERKGRLPAANAVRTLLPIASALAEAHASGVVHRDLKPENVMLVSDKSGAVIPKLVDFGIAKFRSVDDDSEDRPSSGFVIGTPSYMAPEQAGGREAVAEPADVWALAVILYEAITGRVPFSGTNLMALCFAIMTELPTPVHDQMAGDAELWEIMQRGLAKMASERPSMRAFGTDLAEWAMARGIDSDIAGTSLAAHWSAEPHGSPFSALPPPVSQDRLTPPEEISIPRPASLPSAVRLERSPAPSDVSSEPLPAAVERPRAGKGGAWVVVAVALAVALVFVVTRGRPVASTAAPAAAASSVTTPIASVQPVEPRAVVPASASASAEPVPTSSEPQATPPASASAPPTATITPILPPRSKKLPRKGTLPIAKQPNF
jgi:serine/threonine-protein kinase